MDSDVGPINTAPIVGHDLGSIGHMGELVEMLIKTALPPSVVRQEAQPSRRQ